VGNILRKDFMIQVWDSVDLHVPSIGSLCNSNFSDNEPYNEAMGEDH
jgi:hypothetical protein